MSDARSRVLVVDDEHVMLRAWAEMLPKDSYDVVLADSGPAAVEKLEHTELDAVVTDLMMPGGMSGLDLLRHVKRSKPDVEVVLMTAFATVETAVEALKGGAYDYLVKPFDIDHAARVVERAVDRKRLVDRNHQLEAALEVKDRFGELIGTSPAMLAVFELVRQVARSTATVLLAGESGTGKELVARAIHFQSDRKRRSFVPVNCGALTETLLESELFGHEKGAFTGAVSARKGLFEAADGGTIFLDEVGEVTPATQVKLLRVLQEGEVRPVGSNRPRSVDVRVLGASNKLLEEQVRIGEFREDLYFRLNVINIELPPLRDRAEDVPPLAHHFLKMYAKRMSRDVRRIDPDVMAALQAYSWPGNVRELQNIIERAVVLQQGDTIELRALPTKLQERAYTPPEGDSGFTHLPFPDAKKAALASFEQRYVSLMLQRTGGNKAQAARLAGMDRANFRRILKKYDIDGAV